jgi:hypothetical protein
MALQTFITKYFKNGLNYCEIVAMLARENDINISERHLKRLLSKYGLFRRHHYTDVEEVSDFIRKQLQSSGQLHGYRWMWLKCLQHGFVVQKETIRHLLKLLDPNGVETRQRRCLKRRNYCGKGPNFLWHVDGYDKLKPFGFCISGCIDGYSRKLVWIKVNKSNNDPRVIASYYLEAVSDLGSAPTSLRTDMGTENCYLADMQVFLRRNGTDDIVRGGRAFLYGTSQHNQRIESWWSILRRQNSSFWINFFHELKDDGYYTGDYIDKNVLQFCFMDIIRVNIILLHILDLNCYV